MWSIKDLLKQELPEEPIEITSADMTIMGHNKYINSVKVSPNDKLIASSSQDKTIKIWNA